MTYLHFSPASRNTWTVTAPMRSPKPFATITRYRKGGYNTKYARKPSRGEQASIEVFTADRVKDEVGLPLYRALKRWPHIQALAAKAFDIRRGDL